jgi:hypothetical protein
MGEGGSKRSLDERSDPGLSEIHPRVTQLRHVFGEPTYQHSRYLARPTFSV